MHACRRQRLLNSEYPIVLLTDPISVVSIPLLTATGDFVAFLHFTGYIVLIFATFIEGVEPGRPVSEKGSDSILQTFYRDALCAQKYKHL